MKMLARKLVASAKDCGRILFELPSMLRRGLHVLGHEWAIKAKAIRRSSIRCGPTDVTAEQRMMGPRSGYQVTHEFGVNLAGFLTGQFGGAASARAFANALKLGEVPHVLNNVVAKVHGERRISPSGPVKVNPYPINLIHINVDVAERFFKMKGPAYTQERHNIGVWYWELARFPRRWVPTFNSYDEMWATSSFISECLSEVSPIPVLKIRYPLFIDTGILDSRAREKFGIREEDYVFLFLFDFLSVFERKNPIALLRAFRQAFGREKRVLLLLNQINSWANPAAARDLRRSSSNLNIRTIDKHLSEQDYFSLLATCDCYVSLHRSEGLGLPLAEAMYFGKPVIATGYSGNMDFMNANNSLLVRHILVELEKDYGPYEKCSVWAEPDVEHAAQLMRWTYENQDKAAAMGKRGSMDVKQSMDPTVAAQEIRSRLEQIYRGLS
jgi:glycosyltransferase involved in cell wall biosynthesis